MPYNDKVERKDLNKFFGFKNHGKMLFCPCPGYGTRLELWRHFISETGLDFPELQKAPKFDLDTLAYISEGYSAGNIQQAVLTVLPQRRVKKLQQNSLGFSSVEFITALSKTTYTYRDDYDDFREFTDLVTGEKERQRQKTLALAAQAEASSTQKKKKK
jgi:hypothetical protein